VGTMYEKRVLQVVQGEEDTLERSLRSVMGCRVQDER
jgi:hypothetical protein